MELYVKASLADLTTGSYKAAWRSNRECLRCGRGLLKGETKCLQSGNAFCFGGSEVSSHLLAENLFGK